MNTVDVIVVMVVLLNGIIGAFKGFLWQALRLGSIVLGFWLAGILGPRLAALMEGWLGWDETGRNVIGFVTVFAGTYLVCSILAHYSRKLIDKARLASFDRSLGFLLGGAKGLILIWVAFYFISMFSVLLPSYVDDQLQGKGDVPPSKAYAMWAEWIFDVIDARMPESIQQEAQRQVRDATRK